MWLVRLPKLIQRRVTLQSLIDGGLSHSLLKLLFSVFDNYSDVAIDAFYLFGYCRPESD
jgi:hypothetical protein